MAEKKEGPPRLPPGTILADKYRVERELGVGGMGVVLEVTHLHLDERLALKLLLPDLVNDSEFVARFFREGRAAVKIKSPHVTHVHDVGALADGQPYIVMELLHGEDLAHVLDRETTLAVATAVDYVLQASHAIAEAHAAGIVHRDLKPSNLFLTRKSDDAPCVKVMDFGISKVVDPNKPDLSLTRTATVMGSPLYMAPEQMRSTRQVDARADVWALGTILYELVAGVVPFNAATMPELCAMILQDSPPSLHAKRPDVPKELEAAILRCLEKRPDDRFASVGALADALAPFASPLGRSLAITKAAPLVTSSPLLGDTTGPRSVLVSSGSLPGARTERAWTTLAGNERPQRRALLAIGLGGLGASLLLGGGVALLMRHGAHEATPSLTTSASPTASAAAAESVPIAPSEPAVPSASSASSAAPPAATASAAAVEPEKKAPRGVSHAHSRASGGATAAPTAAPAHSAAPASTSPAPGTAPGGGLATDRHG